MKRPQNVDMSNVMPGVEFEGIYNRDSVKYIDLYNIPDVHTLLRGVFRYKVIIRELKITVGHQPFSEHFPKMLEWQNIF